MAMATFLGVQVDNSLLWAFIDRLPAPSCHLSGARDEQLRAAIFFRPWGRLPKQCASTAETCATHWRLLMTRLLFNSSRAATYRSAIPLHPACSSQNQHPRAK